VGVVKCQVFQAILLHSYVEVGTVVSFSGSFVPV
jgi:hypothetical protein